MTEQQIDILVLVIGLPLFGVGLYLWAKAARHMFGLLTNFKPNMTWGRFIPICIFIPNFFTEQGNIHRVALLKYAGLFIIFCGTPFIIIGLWELLAK
jgi:hypothetical protein